MSRNDRDNHYGRDDEPSEPLEDDGLSELPAADSRRPWRGGPRQWARLIAREEVDRGEKEEPENPLLTLSGPALYDYLKELAEQNRPQPIPRGMRSHREPSAPAARDLSAPAARDLSAPAARDLSAPAARDLSVPPSPGPVLPSSGLGGPPEDTRYRRGRNVSSAPSAQEEAELLERFVREEEARLERQSRDEALRRERQAREDEARRLQIAREDEARREQLAREELARLERQAREDELRRERIVEEERALKERLAREEEARRAELAREEEVRRDQLARQEKARLEQLAREEEARRAELAREERALRARLAREEEARLEQLAREAELKAQAVGPVEATAPLEVVPPPALDPVPEPAPTPLVMPESPRLETPLAPAPAVEAPQAEEPRLEVVATPSTAASLQAAPLQAAPPAAAGSAAAPLQAPPPPSRVRPPPEERDEWDAPSEEELELEGTPPVAGDLESIYEPFTGPRPPSRRGAASKKGPTPQDWTAQALEEVLSRSRPAGGSPVAGEKSRHGAHLEVEQALFAEADPRRAPTPGLPRHRRPASRPPLPVRHLPPEPRAGAAEAPGPADLRQAAGRTFRKYVPGQGNMDRHTPPGPTAAEPLNETVSPSIVHPGLEASPPPAVPPDTASAGQGGAPEMAAAEGAAPAASSPGSTPLAAAPAASSPGPAPSAMTPTPVASPPEPDLAAVRRGLLRTLAAELEQRILTRAHPDEPLPSWMESLTRVFDEERLDGTPTRSPEPPPELQVFWQEVIARLPGRGDDETRSELRDTALKLEAALETVAALPARSTVEAAVKKYDDSSPEEYTEEWEIDDLLSSALDGDTSDAAKAEIRAVLREVLEHDTVADALVRELPIPAPVGRPGAESWSALTIEDDGEPVPMGEDPDEPLDEPISIRDRIEMLAGAPETADTELPLELPAAEAPYDPLAEALGEIERGGPGLVVVESEHIDVSVAEGQDVQIQGEVEEIEGDEAMEDDTLSTVLSEIEGSAYAVSTVPEGWEQATSSESVQVSGREPDPRGGYRGEPPVSTYPGADRRPEPAGWQGQEPEGRMPPGAPRGGWGSRPPEPGRAMPGGPRGWEGPPGREPRWERDERYDWEDPQAEDDQEEWYAEEEWDYDPRYGAPPPMPPGSRGRPADPEAPGRPMPPPPVAGQEERGERPWWLPPQPAAVDPYAGGPRGRELERRSYRGQPDPAVDPYERYEDPRGRGGWRQGSEEPWQEEGPPGRRPGWDDRPRGAGRSRDWSAYQEGPVEPWERDPRRGHDPFEDWERDPYRQGGRGSREPMARDYPDRGHRSQEKWREPAGRSRRVDHRPDRGPEYDPWVSGGPEPRAPQERLEPPPSRGDSYKRLFDWPDGVEPPPADLWSGTPSRPDPWAPAGRRTPSRRPVQRVSDRRLHPRIVGHAGMVYFRCQGRIAMGELGDLSISGAMIRTRTPVAPGTHIPVAIELPTLVRPLRMMARVIYVRRLEAPSGYDLAAMGVAFEQVEPEERLTLEDYLQRFGG